MSERITKRVSGATVRIWTGPKERLVKVLERKEKKEDRIISEAELVSRAVNEYCAKEEKKLGLV